MSKIEMPDLLDLVVDEGASDLHVRAGIPPVLRLRGEMIHLEVEALTADDTERLAKSITSDANMQKLQQMGTVDFGFSFGTRARFRSSIFKEKAGMAMVLRQIPNTLFAFDALGLPSQVRELIRRPRGLILVTGPTGSGKSTTLASMINEVNIEDSGHIITVEDPIEFYHNHKRCIVTQREVGTHVPSFEDALRRALRQDPDVILVGEMRDLETIGAAISAAETGHLVFGTLHTTGAAETIDRIIDAFPTNQQEQVRSQLASALVLVISQVLLKRADKVGRIAAYEIMVATPSIRALIRDHKTYRITSDIQTGAKFGMNTLDAHLMQLYLSGKISYGDMLGKSKDPEAVAQDIQKLQGSGPKR
jgi:twitching motility protein PilT